MSKANMNYRVQVCGWPRGCFDAEGNQIYTPRELEMAAQADVLGPCPSGVCVPMGRGHNLTGAYNAEVLHARRLEAETNSRLVMLCQGEWLARGARGVETQRLGNGGEWMSLGGQEVRQAAQEQRSLWEAFTER